MTIETRVPDHAISRRPIEDSDLAFLLQVYTTTREDIATSPLSDEQKTALFSHQFESQHAHYQKFFAGAQFDIVLMDDRPVGRIYVHHNEEEFRVIDIAILPEFRGRGIGSVVMQEVIAEAERHDLPVRLRVEPENPARQWYERLGFTKIADENVNWHMERAA